MKRSSIFICSLGLVVFLSGSALQASLIAPAVPGSKVTVMGDNSVWDKYGNKFYIPQSDPFSGQLGQLVLGAKPGSTKKKNLIGLHSDRFRLRGDVGTSTTGFTTTNVVFDLPEPPMGEDAALILTFRDLDLLPQKLRRATLTETLELTLLTNVLTGEDDGAAALGASSSFHLSLTSGNYGLYRPDGFGPTNYSRRNRQVTYTIPLTDLGMTKLDIYAIDATKSFTLEMTMTAEVTRTKRGSNVYRNTVETGLVSVSYTPDYDAPEPMTMALLIAGLPLLLRRRR